MQPKQTKSKATLWFYVPLWLLFVYLYFQILAIGPNGSGNIILGGMYFVEFGVHEASHMVTAFLPSILCAAAGSIGEMTFTWLLAYAAFRAKSYFAGAFTLLWVMLAMTSAGNYMADARAQQMQLIGLGSDPKHDWNYVFGQLGWLNWDTFIGGTVRLLGDVAGLVGLIIGLVVIIGIVFRPNQVRGTTAT
ncbi:MAG TPA: hypothetical protein VMT96_00955 [Candidatus Bathyarchaeia archaeon]|nr:hypothetical protein [Candidatus Bathyarchaeia archaeon]